MRTADTVGLLLLSLSKGNRNLQYNCHEAKIVYNNGKKRDINLKISKFRVLIITQLQSIPFGSRYT